MLGIRNIVAIVFFAMVFVVFFNGYQQEGPARRKFKRLGESEEVIDLTKQQALPEVNRMKDVSGDKRLREWASWWQKCLPGFSTDKMDDIGTTSMGEMSIPSLTPDMGAGPQTIFYRKSPDGKWLLNPYYGRLSFKKEGDAWQPYVELPCGAALYDTKSKSGKSILDCSALEGIDDAFWKGPDTIVLMGYGALTRQMDVECEGVESCVSPVVWIVDTKTKSINEHRGSAIKRKTTSCELGGYLKIRLPEFFNEEKK